MTYPAPPPDTRAAGQSGHIADHNTIADSLTALESAVGGLQLSQSNPALVPTAVHTAAYTASPSDFVVCDVSGGAFTVKLPQNAPDATRVGVKVISVGSNVLTVQCQGSDVLNKTGGSTSITLALLNQGVIFQYKSSLSIWYITADDLPLAALDSRYSGGVTLDSAATDIQPVGTRTAGSTGKASDAAHVHAQQAAVTPTGLTGATAATRYVGATASGPPGSGTFAVGDFAIDQTGAIFVCTTAGTPGSWTFISRWNPNVGSIQPSPGTASAGSAFAAADASHVHGQPPVFAPTGLTGATQASRYVGATASGAPGSGTFALGDFVIDQTGKVWICTTAGSPGTWTQAGGSSGGVTLGKTYVLTLGRYMS
jgi:hypothetical protein